MQQSDVEIGKGIRQHVFNNRLSVVLQSQDKDDRLKDEENVRKMKVKQIKEQLEQRNLPSKGLKTSLSKLLVEELQRERILRKRKQLQETNEQESNLQPLAKKQKTLSMHSGEKLNKKSNNHGERYDETNDETNDDTNDKQDIEDGSKFDQKSKNQEDNSNPLFFDEFISSTYPRHTMIVMDTGLLKTKFRYPPGRVVHLVSHSKELREQCYTELISKYPQSVDCPVKIQNHEHISSAVDLSKDGDVILIFPGQYKISERLIFHKKNVEILGYPTSDRGNHVVLVDDNNTLEEMITLYQSHVRFYNLIIQQKTFGYMFEGLIAVRDGSALELDHCTLNCKDSGVLVKRRCSTVIKNSTIRGSCTSAIEISMSASYVLLDSNIFSHNCKGYDKDSKEGNIPLDFMMGAPYFSPGYYSAIEIDATKKSETSRILLSTSSTNTNPPLTSGVQMILKGNTIRDNAGPPIGIRTLCQDKVQRTKEVENLTFRSDHLIVKCETKNMVKQYFTSVRKRIQIDKKNVIKNNEKGISVNEKYRDGVHHLVTLPEDIIHYCIPSDISLLDKPDLRDNPNYESYALTSNALVRIYKKKKQNDDNDGNTAMENTDTPTEESLLSLDQEKSKKKKESRATKKLKSRKECESDTEEVAQCEDIDQNEDESHLLCNASILTYIAILQDQIQYLEFRKDLFIGNQKCEVCGATKSLTLGLKSDSLSEQLRKEVKKTKIPDFISENFVWKKVRVCPNGHFTIFMKNC